MKRVLAILDTMWGWGNVRRKTAPRFFDINPNNHSGRRLYTLVGGAQCRLLVTNCCKECVSHAHQHGIPDAAWLRENLEKAPPCDLILVCGRVAWKTFNDVGYKGTAKVLFLDHPAARRWTKEKMEQCQAAIKEALREV